jgi:anti-sigma B factor antagonist
MDIVTTEHKRCVVVKTQGRVDGSNAPELKAALKDLTESGKFNLVFDMTEVNFMASAGWWVLIDTQKTCKHLNRGELVLSCIDKSIQDSLNLVGMSSYFKTFDDLISAVGSF